jgi:hypothetical protein
VLHSNLELFASTEQQQTDHVLIQKPRVKRPQVRLPFGIKAPKRRRQPLGKSKAGRHGGRSIPAPIEHNSSAPSPQRSSSTSTTSSSSGNTSDSDYTSEGSEGSLSSDNSRPSNLKSHKVVQEASNILQDEVAAHVQGSTRIVEGPVATDKTFFNSHVGILDLKQGQPKSRGRAATCYNCEKLIEKAECRYVYSYNIRRPWKYIHDFCLVAFVRQQESDSVLADAIMFLSDFQCNADKESQLREIAATALQQLSVKSSSSTDRS